MTFIKTNFLVVFMFLAIVAFGQNNSLHFDGNDDYVNIPHSSSLAISSNPVTIELWFKAPDVAQKSVLITKRSPVIAWNSLSLIINGGNVPSQGPGKKIVFVIGEPMFDYSYVITQNDIVDGNWHHVAGVVDQINETVTLYVDGVAVPVTSSSSPTFPSVTNMEPFTVGQANSNTFFYDGLIDDIRIWESSRSQVEIQANMSTELTGSETDLISYYKFDQSDATCDIIDCNINENHGTRIGPNGSNNAPQFSSDTPNLVDVACGANIPCESCQANTVFTEVSGNNWNTVENWSGGCVPTSPVYGNITINGKCYLNVIGDFLFEEGSTLTINIGDTLIVANNVNMVMNGETKK